MNHTEFFPSTSFHLDQLNNSSLTNLCLDRVLPFPSESLANADIYSIFPFMVGNAINFYDSKMMFLTKPDCENNDKDKDNKDKPIQAKVERIPREEDASEHANDMQIAQYSPSSRNRRVIITKKTIKKGAPDYADVTPFLGMPQNQAAAQLGIPSSTLSKRWKEATMNRKWPYRTVAKLDKEICTLMKNAKSPMEGGCHQSQNQLASLMARREEELRKVMIRLN